MTIIETPYLPQKPVKAVLIDQRAGQGIFQFFREKNIKTIPVPPCEDLEEPVSSHPDMLCHLLSENKILIYKKKAESIADELIQLGFQVITDDSVLKKEYPYDVCYNAARIGNRVLLNPKTVSSFLYDYYIKSGLEIIEVQQGYTKCSVCIVDENSIITSDPGIERAAEKSGLDVLLIRQGGILIDRYDYGFIGGCSGKLDRETVCFSGLIVNHPDYNLIENFLSERGIKALSLSREALTDIGSIIPLTED